MNPAENELQWIAKTLLLRAMEEDPLSCAEMIDLASALSNICRHGNTLGAALPITAHDSVWAHPTDR